MTALTTFHPSILLTLYPTRGSRMADALAVGAVRRPPGPPLRSKHGRRRRKSTRSAADRESESARDLARCTGVSALGPLVDSMPARLTDSMPTDRTSDQSRALPALRTLRQHAWTRPAAHAQALLLRWKAHGTPMPRIGRQPIHANLGHTSSKSSAHHRDRAAAARRERGVGSGPPGLRAGARPSKRGARARQGGCRPAVMRETAVRPWPWILRSEAVLLRLGWGCPWAAAA